MDNDIGAAFAKLKGSLRLPIRGELLGRFGKPEEIVEAVRFLSKATWMTGQTIYVDGGMLATGLAYIGSLRRTT